MLHDLASALQEKNITLKWDESVEKWIAHESYSLKFGARNMHRFIQTHIEDVLADQIISGYQNDEISFIISLDQNGLSVNRAACS